MKCFFFDSVLGNGVPRLNALDMDEQAVLAQWDDLSAEPGSFLGLVGANGYVLQFMWEDDCTVTVDVPLPEKAGSLTKQADCAECSELISRVFDGEDLTALTGLRFLSWGRAAAGVWSKNCAVGVWSKK